MPRKLDWYKAKERNRFHKILGPPSLLHVARLHRVEMTEAIEADFLLTRFFNICDGSSPDGFDKNDKPALRKSFFFFAVEDTKPYYTSDGF